MDTVSVECVVMYTTVPYFKCIYSIQAIVRIVQLPPDTRI